METILKLHPNNIVHLKAHIRAKGPSVIHGDGNIYPHIPNWTPDSGVMNHSYNNAELSNPNREEASYFKVYNSVDEVPDTVEKLQDELIAAKFKKAAQDRSNQGKVVSNTFDVSEPKKSAKAEKEPKEPKAEKEPKTE